jgi:hypothetical protein
MQNSLSFNEKNVSSTRKRMYCNFTMEDLPKQKNHYRKIEYLSKFFIFLGIDEYNCIIFLDTETDQHIRHIDELKKFISAVYSPPLSLFARDAQYSQFKNFWPSSASVLHVVATCHWATALPPPRAVLHAPPPALDSAASPRSPAFDAATIGRHLMPL